MKTEKAIKILEEILQPFERSIAEAEIGDTDAIDAEQSNREAIEALNIAISALKKRGNRTDGI